MAVAQSRLEAARRVRGIDHVTIETRDARAARRFYELALRPLGFSVLLDWPDRGRTYLGLPAEPSSLWLVQDDDPGRVSLSLAAADRSAVDAFYAAALASGARPLASPAPRPEHTPFTYGAAIRDPDGHTVEAVCWHAGRLEHAAEHAAA